VKLLWSGHSCLGRLTSHAWMDHATCSSRLLFSQSSGLFYPDSPEPLRVLVVWLIYYLKPCGYSQTSAAMKGATALVFLLPVASGLLAASPCRRGVDRPGGEVGDDRVRRCGQTPDFGGCMGEVGNTRMFRRGQVWPLCSSSSSSSNARFGPNTDMEASSPNFSLASVRRSLIRQEETIIFALIERAQFVHNQPVYERGAQAWSQGGVDPWVRDGQASFLDFMLLETEKVFQEGGGVCMDWTGRERRVGRLQEVYRVGGVGRMDSHGSGAHAIELFLSVNHWPRLPPCCSSMPGPGATYPRRNTHSTLRCWTSTQSLHHWTILRCSYHRISTSTAR